MKSMVHRTTGVTPARRTSRRLRIGLVGCGAIGSQLALFVERRAADRAVLSGIHDHHPEHAEALSRRLRTSVEQFTLAQLVRRSDLLIEAAAADIVPRVVRLVASAGKSALIMSTGGLLLNADTLAMARRMRGRVYLPSGALPGLDAVQAAGLGKITRVTLTTFKSPRSLEGAPYVVKRRIDLGAVKRPTTLFEGTPRQAVRAFPKNVNVCATLALAAGRVPLRVRLVADPSLTRNVHEVELLGDAGRLHLRAENVPDPSNPRTSRLAALSAMACLEKILTSVSIGT